MWFGSFGIKVYSGDRASELARSSLQLEVAFLPSSVGLLFQYWLAKRCAGGAPTCWKLEELPWQCYLSFSSREILPSITPHLPFLGNLRPALIFGVLQSNSPMLQVTWFDHPSSLLATFPGMQVVMPVFFVCHSNPPMESHFSHNSVWALSWDWRGKKCFTERFTSFFHYGKRYTIKVCWYIDPQQS